MSRLTASHPNLGTLVLHANPDEPAPAGQAFYFYTLAGLDFGDAEPVTQVIDELIGSLVEVDRWSNRQPVLTVTCAAADGDSLAQGEQRLAAFLSGRFELIWEPIAPFSAPVSLWIEPGSRWPRVDEPQGLEWDLAESLHCRRSWQLTLAARPFALAADPAMTSWALSGNQGTEQVTVGGVAPANCSLTVSADSGLGSVVAHVARTDLPYTPALRSRMTSSTSTLTRSGVAAFAGTSWRQLNGCSFDIPANTLPDGPYELLAHLHTQTADLDTTVTWTAQGYDGAYAVGPQETGDTTLAFAGTADQMASLGRLALPIQGNASSTAFLRLTISAATDLYLDEMWLLWIAKNDAALLRGELGTGTPTIGAAYSRMEIQPPTVIEPRQLLMLGADSTAPVRAGALMPVRDRLAFQPGLTQVYVGCSGIAGAAVEFGVTEAFRHHGSDS